LDKIIISFKYNNRVINKTINYYQKYVEQADGSWKKTYVKQTINPDHWAIRNAIHQETVYGKLTEKVYKSVTLSTALKDPARIANKSIRKEILRLFKQLETEKEVKKHLKKNPILRNEKEVSKVEYIDYADYATSKLRLDESIKVKQIESIVDKSTKYDVYKHLEKYHGDIKEAFSENGLIEFNSSRLHKVETVTVKQDYGISKQLGEQIPKNRQIVKGAKGTNLFYVIHEDNQSKKLQVDKESTVAFMDVIDAMKDKEEFVVPRDGMSYFTLSPGDLVYVFDEGEERVLPEKIEYERIYKCVSFTKIDCFFIPNQISNVLENKKEFGPLNKLEKSLFNTTIKRNCIKLNIDRLGHLIK
jgi:CRISPR-associated endonuclease Csn1